MEIKVRILIADDHSAIKSGIKHTLWGEFPCLEFDEALDPDDIFQKLHDSVWDMLIFDIDLPGKNGLEVLRQINQQGLNIPVLVFSNLREDQFALSALNAGASGYLSKENAATDLLIAVKQVLSGCPYISAYVCRQLDDLYAPIPVADPYL